MALSPTEESLVRQLIAQNPALLNLASSESTIISKLGATKVSLSDLSAATSLSDADLALVRQGLNDKSFAMSVLRDYVSANLPTASTTTKGIVELATNTETQTGTDAVRAVTPAGLASVTATETRAGLLEIATTAEAQALVNDTHALTPAKLAVGVPIFGGLFRNLKLSATGVNASVSVSADFITLDSVSLGARIAKTVALTINSATVGANGLDTGTLAASTWYSVWVISDGTTTAGLLSLSATAPTLPSGYTHKARVGWIRTDATANKYPMSFVQYGRRVQYRVAAGSNVSNSIMVASGVAGSISTPTWVPAGISNFVPPTAESINLRVFNNGASGAMVAPNNAYGAYNSATNPPLILAFPLTGGSVFMAPTDMHLESSNIYWASSDASAKVYCCGWEDNL